MRCHLLSSLVTSSCAETLGRVRARAASKSACVSGRSASGESGSAPRASAAAPALLRSSRMGASAAVVQRCLRSEPLYPSVRLRRGPDRRGEG